MGRYIAIPIGSKFGKLTTLDLPIRKCTGKTTKLMFECRCDCGAITWVTGSKLRSGKKLQCLHCGYKTRPQSTMRLSNVERLYRLSISGRCKKSKITNNLNIKDFENLIKQDCYYCGQSPKLISHLIKNKIALNSSIYANGIDRVDSTKGYSLENCVPCCKQCNIMKMNYTFEEFLNKIKILYEKWIKK